VKLLLNDEACKAQTADSASSERNILTLATDLSACLPQMPIKVTRKKTATVSPFCPILTFNASLIVFAIFVCFDQSLATFFYYLKLRFAAFCCCFSWRVPERVPGPFYCSTGSASVCADTPTPHSMTLPTSADARRLKSRHPFVPAAQQLISFSDNNNIRAVHWADYQWNAEWTDNPTRLRILIPDTGTHPPRNDPPKKGLGPAQPPPHRCRTFPLLLVQMGYGLLCGLRVWRRTNRRPCRPALSNPSTSSRTTRPDGSGR